MDLTCLQYGHQDVLYMTTLWLQPASAGTEASESSVAATAAAIKW
jgi:hypothetical protein